MRTLSQPGPTAPQQPRWLRWAAVLGILLVLVMSTVQVCHTHVLEPQAGSHQTLPDHCPLCVVMQAAMPATLQAAPEPALHMQALDSAAADAERRFRWRFQLASRPPPGTARS